MDAVFKALAVVVGTLAVHGAAAQSSQEDPLVWSDERPLEWSDFRGPVDQEANARTAASTASGLEFGYSVQVTRIGEECSFEIGEVQTRATFDPGASWVRGQQQRTAAILAHEQGHFDLTEVHRRMLEREAGMLTGEARPCPEGAPMTEVQNMAAETMEPVRERIWQGLQRVQEQYDAETEHGLNAAAQREWRTRIDAALRRGRW